MRKGESFYSETESESLRPHNHSKFNPRIVLTALTILGVARRASYAARSASSRAFLLRSATKFHLVLGRKVYTSGCFNSSSSIRRFNASDSSWSDNFRALSFSSPERYNSSNRGLELSDRLPGAECGAGSPGLETPDRGVCHPDLGVFHPLVAAEAP